MAASALRADSTLSPTLLDTNKTIRLGLFFKKKTELLIEIPVGVGEAFSSATRVCGWHRWTSRKRTLIEKVKSTWERRWGSFSWRGPIRDTVGWSRWTGGPRNLGCILWQLSVDLCLALEGKDDELFPPLRAVCSSLDPGGPLGLPRRDLMEYTELRKQYWTIQRIRQRPSIVRMVD